MFTFVQTNAKSDVTPVSSLIKNDTEALKWLAYYADAEEWSSKFSRAKYPILAYLNGELAGFVDLEFSQDGSMLTFAYYLAPEMRGRGLAKSLVTEALAWVKNNTNGRVVLAYVNDKNTRSLHVLNSANFLVDSHKDNMIYMTYVLN